MRRLSWLLRHVVIDEMDDAGWVPIESAKTVLQLDKNNFPIVHFVHVVHVILYNSYI